MERRNIIKVWPKKVIDGQRMSSRWEEEGGQWGILSKSFSFDSEWARTYKECFFHRHHCQCSTFRDFAWLNGEKQFSWVFELRQRQLDNNSYKCWAFHSFQLCWHGNRDKTDCLNINRSTFVIKFIFRLLIPVDNFILHCRMLIIMNQFFRL